ncbi:MAG: hypothetical protein FD144_4792 [Rhodospirillaceae bacterium]|nr:MAG: hypothetical protein FD144_4792 [Rhodospirillaceae bacterium]
MADDARRTEERGASTSGAIPAADATAETDPGRLSTAPSGTTSSTTAAEEGLTAVEAREAIEFDVLRNALLHTMRQRWFDALHRWLMFLIVLSGTAGVATLSVDLVGPAVFAAATSLFATLDLVLDLRPKARLHDDLRRRYYLLMAEIAAVPTADAATVAGWRAAMLRLTAEEPDLYRVVDCVAYNATVRSLGRDPGHLLVIPWWRRQLGHLWTFPGFDPPQRRELEQDKENPPASADH